jgi:oxygen-independent coproporphyrinogen-3 oxidase
MLALEKQLRFELDRFRVKERDIESIFIGGGTPSTIKPRLYISIFRLLYPFIKEGAEITIEANPNSASLSWLEDIFNLGINRVSFGVQSFCKDKLKALNRSHSPQQAVNAITNAKKIGFKHISLDLIYNYYKDTKEILQKDIDEAFRLPIDHISAYELTIEDKTAFSFTPEVRREDDDLAFFVADEIKKRGFKHYEISNFGVYESYHNKGYWELKDYIGIGAGAVGFKKDERYYPTTNIDSYIKNPLNIDVEKLSRDELLTEKIFLGLRSTIGVDENLLDSSMRERADFLVRENRLEKESSIYKNSNFFLSDEIALYILA